MAKWVKKYRQQRETSLYESVDNILDLFLFSLLPFCVIDLTTLFVPFPNMAAASRLYANFQPHFSCKMVEAPFPNMI